MSQKSKLEAIPTAFSMLFWDERSDASFIGLMGGAVLASGDEVNE
jgi:hypothetical protein